MAAGGSSQAYRDAKYDTIIWSDGVPDAICLKSFRLAEVYRVLADQINESDNIYHSAKNYSKRHKACGGIFLNDEN